MGWLQAACDTEGLPYVSPSESWYQVAGVVYAALLGQPSNSSSVPSPSVSVPSQISSVPVVKVPPVVPAPLALSAAVSFQVPFTVLLKKVPARSDAVPAVLFVG